VEKEGAVFTTFTLELSVTADWLGGTFTTIAAAWVAGLKLGFTDSCFFV
jgi:hypothetical protein